MKSSLEILWKKERRGRCVQGVSRDARADPSTRLLARHSDHAGLVRLAALAARANAVRRVRRSAVQARAGRVDVRLTLPASFRPAALDLPADGRPEGQACRATAPLAADGNARDNRVYHLAGNSARSLGREAPGLAGAAA